MSIIELKNVDIVFGDNPNSASDLIKKGQTREQIAKSTGQIIGAVEANLDIYSGEFCVLMGLSGSGKSTLLRGINGLNPVTNGQILLEHDNKKVDLTKCSSSLLRKIRRYRIAMVFQQFALLPWLTVAENAAFGLHIRGMNKRKCLDIVNEKLEMVGLLPWKDKFVHELSGGMQQRVGLARAFATDADILLMDEPFSALDPLIRSKLQDDLLALQKRLKKTIIFVSHDLDEAIKLGNRIAIMEGGRIVQYAKPEEIVLNPASEYVAEFVSHMNPLQVMSGHSVMCHRKDFNYLENEQSYQLDWSGLHTIELDKNDQIKALYIERKSTQFVHWHKDLNFQTLADNIYITAPEDILLADLIKIRHKTGRPAILMNQQNQVIGYVGGDEIYQAILRQQNLMDQFKNTSQTT